VSIYLDANVLVALFTVDPLNDRAEAALRASPDILLISELAAAEFSATVALRMRKRILTAAEAKSTFANFDQWTSVYAERVETTSGDVTEAHALIRRLNAPLRAPDAIHLATSMRTVARLLTFDRQLAQAARTLRIPLTHT
jgi:uncharacterized protein